MSNQVTIKTECACIQDHHQINKVIAVINATNLAKLIDVVGLTANPRKSKKNSITTAICDTLEKSPSELRFRSKGMLISSSSCIPNQRNRFTLSFEDDKFEGVLDGGHNMLAVGLFILKEYFGEQAGKNLGSIKKWDDFIEVWKLHRDDLQDILPIFEFEMPIEIIYPNDKYQAKFPDLVFEISDARNNNASLSAGTKADHKGYYEVLKNALDNEVKSNVEWKDGDGGRIKRDDIVAMSLIPMLALQKASRLKPSCPQINQITIYSGKGKCVDTFSEIFEEYSNDEGIIEDTLFLSAISLLGELPRLYDLIYELFPDAYNSHSPGFGRMDCVRIYDPSKRSDKKYTRKQPRTKYYERECKNGYPEGFIIPVFAALCELMEVREDKLVWKMDNPTNFLRKHFDESVKLLVSVIKDSGYIPNEVGKKKGAYEGMSAMFELLASKYL